MKPRYVLRFLLLVAVVLTLGSGATWGQSSKIAKADAYFNTGGYAKALPLYKKLLETVSKDDLGEYLFKVGECYRRTGEYRKACIWYHKAVMREYRNPKVHLYYGQSLLSTGKYEEAKVEFEQYQGLMPNDELAANGLKSIELAKSWKQNPTGYQVRAIRGLNSREADYCPMYGSKDYRTLFFTSSRPAAMGKEEHAGTGEKFTDIFVSLSNGDGKWSRPKPMGGTVNTKDEEGTPNVTSEFTKFYYTQCKATKRRRKKGQRLGCQIYEARQTGQGFDEPKLVNLAPDSIVVAHPAISPDGLKLYFTSDLPGGFGGLDIWRVERSSPDAEWGKPINMGSQFNTAGNEMFPYVHNDSTIYFSSNGLPGMGGLDIFKASPAKGGKYTVENMRNPVNSSYDDFGMTFKAEQEDGFFSSNRKGGRGGDDIYWFYLAPLLFNLEGVIVDDKDGKPLANAKVKLMGSDGSIQYAETNAEGKYKFMLSANTDYVAVSSNKGFLNNKVKVSTKGKTKSEDFKEDLKMKYAAGGKAIALPNIFYDFGSYNLRPESEEALRLLIEILNDNPNIVIELGAHTDGVGSLKYNYELSQQRAQAVVNYLIQNGIEPARLRAKGYAQTKPVTVSAALHGQLDFLPEGQKLTEKFIETLPNDEQKESARQVNRRTAFRVISDTYTSKASGN